MLRCALIIPPWQPEEIFPSKTLKSQINYWQPLGILYIAAMLETHGHEVKFFNGAFLDSSSIIQSLKRFSPQLVGLYSTTFGWPKAKTIARQIKRALKDVFIVVGGPYPTAAGSQCLQEEGSIDAVAIGEAEYIAVELATNLSEGKDLHSIRGLIFRQSQKIIHNPPAPVPEELDSLPFPARHLLGNPDRYLPPPATYKRKPVAVVITSRGCNRRCIFCFQMDPKRRIRYRSIENVIAELRQLKSQGYREIKFIDDSLSANRHRAIALAESIKKEGLNFTWFASVCAHQVDRTLLRAFKEAGCWAVLIGAESGVQKNLNSLKKGITVEQIKKAVKLAKEEGLVVHVPFLIGIPGQTREDILKTIEFACEIDPHIVNFHCLTPFPGTELYEKASQFGTLSDNLEDYTYQGAAFVPYTLTKEEMLSLRQYAFKRFYARPKYLLRRLLMIRNLNDLKASIRGIVSLVRIVSDNSVFLKKDQHALKKT